MSSSDKKLPGRGVFLIAKKIWNITTHSGKTTLFDLFCFLSINTERGGQVFISTHSPDLLNAATVDEVFWLIKEKGYTTIKRAGEDAQITAFMEEGDKMGYLWKQGFFEGVDPNG